MGTIAQLTIAISTAVSDSFNAPNDPSYDAVLVKIPVAWTAADLKLQFSDDGGTTWYNVTLDDGTVAKITSIPTTGGELALEPLDANSGLGKWSAAMRAIPNGVFRVVSINTGTGVDENQAAARSLDILTS